MKTIDYYMHLPYKMEIIPDVDEGGYTVRFPDLKGCLNARRSRKKRRRCKTRLVYRLLRRWY